MSSIKFTIKHKSLLDGGDGQYKIVPPADMHVQVLRRIADLFDQYSIERWDWQGLAVALAFEHEPTFKIELDQGLGHRTKPTIWNPARYAMWWYDVTSAKPEYPRFNLEQLCRKVAEGPEWFDSKANVRRFHEAKKTPLVQFCIKAKEHLGDKKFSEIFKGTDWNKVDQYLNDNEFNR